jgi:hypothetical protein
MCYGPTSSITRIDLRKETHERVVTGLPSLAGAGGVAALGAHDISFQGRGGGYVTVGLGADPELRDDLGAPGADLDQLARLLPNGAFANIAIWANGGRGEPAVDEIDAIHTASSPWPEAMSPSRRERAHRGQVERRHFYAGRVPRLVPLAPLLACRPARRSPWTPRTAALGPTAITTSAN